MGLLDNESEIVDASPNISVSSTPSDETPIDKCTTSILQCCSKILQDIQNTTLSIDYVEELEIMRMKDVAHKVKKTYTKVVAFTSFMEEVYCDHLHNKGRNTILITKEYVMYLHHYNEVVFM